MTVTTPDLMQEAATLLDAHRAANNRPQQKYGRMRFSGREGSACQTAGSPAPCGA